jgi:hypothetical protein
VPAKLSYHSPQIPPINRRDTKANASEFFVLHFSIGKTGTEKCRTEKYGSLISQIFDEPFRVSRRHWRRGMSQLLAAPSTSLRNKHSYNGTRMTRMERI